jgi:hypothetical protein
VTTDALLTALYDTLDGQTGVPVYTAGSVPTDEEPPYVVLEIPRSTGSETLDRRRRDDVRQRIRIHDRYPPGRADRAKALGISAAIQTAMKNAFDFYVPPPIERPLPPYEVGPDEAYDLLLIYDFRLSK